MIVLYSHCENMKTLPWKVYVIMARLHIVGILMNFICAQMILNM